VFVETQCNTARLAADEQLRIDELFEPRWLAVPVFEFTLTGKFPPVYDAGVRSDVRGHDPSMGAVRIATRMRNKWFYVRWQRRPGSADEAQFIIGVQRANFTLEPSGSRHSRYDEHCQKSASCEKKRLPP